MLRVSDVMTTYVEFIDLEATAKEAAEMMGELEVGALPAGAADRVEGVVTDRDILYRVVAAGLDPTRVRVREVLSRRSPAERHHRSWRETSASARRDYATSSAFRPSQSHRRGTGALFAYPTRQARCSHFAVRQRRRLSLHSLTPRR